MSAGLRQQLENPANDVYFSAVAAWEICVKRHKGKLAFKGSPHAVANRIGLLELPIRADHCEVSAALPPHHRDPFDRLLIAQAQVEGLVVATSDAVMRAYGVPLLMN